MLKRGRNRKRHRPLPRPSLVVFFFVPGSAFAWLNILLYETRNTKEKTTTTTTTTKNRQLRIASYVYVWACPIKVREGIERVQYFKSKGNVTTKLKQSLREVKPT